MARRNESSLIETLMMAPWWISAILAAISYFGLKFLVPSILQDRAGLLNQSFAKAAPSLAALVSLVFVSAQKKRDRLWLAIEGSDLWPMISAMNSVRI